MTDEPFISFAQNFEDVMLWRALRQVTPGFYIDVGANDPTGDSVTMAFYECGWSGINVEPIQRHHQALVVERPRDINLLCALADKSGETEIWDSDVLGWSTADPTVAEQLRHQGSKGRFVTVPQRTLAEVWDEYVTGEVHFLKIDVEGLEAAVLRGGDFERHRPWIVIIEAIDPTTHKESHLAWEAALLAHRYRLAYVDGVNRFYLAEEHSDLAKHFRHPPNVRDNFVRLAQHRAEEATRAGAERIKELEGALAAARVEAEVALTFQKDAAARARLAEHKLKKVLASSSWRATAPLRALWSLLGRKPR